MSRPTDEQLLAFLEGGLEEPERSRVLEALEQDPDLARELRSAARGLAAVRSLPDPVTRAGGPAVARERTSPLWWAAAAAMVTLALAVPLTAWFMSQRAGAGPEAAAIASAGPAGPDPGFMLVLHGRWPDAATITPEERSRRADEYWSWTSTLADDAILMAAGDLRWEPGLRLGPDGASVAVASDVIASPDFVVGMYALRVASYAEAVAIARACPHLRYGGSISVRQAARGVMTDGRPAARAEGAGAAIPGLPPAAGPIAEPLDRSRLHVVNIAG